MNCNRQANELIEAEGMFQSLIGILMNCNFIHTLRIAVSHRVSIPNRDFNELQLREAESQAIFSF